MPTIILRAILLSVFLLSIIPGQSHGASTEEHGILSKNAFLVSVTYALKTGLISADEGTSLTACFAQNDDMNYGRLTEIVDDVTDPSKFATNINYLVDGTKTSADLLSAASFLAASADKAGTLSIDKVVDMNKILNISGTITWTMNTANGVISYVGGGRWLGTSGTIAQVKVNVGDRVKQGDVLASLDTTDLQLKVTQAEQAYLIQQLNYTNTVQADPGALATVAAQASMAFQSRKSPKGFLTMFFTANFSMKLIFSRSILP